MTQTLASRPNVVEKYGKLVHFMAHKYRWIGMDHAELVQEGWAQLALMLPKFDPARGVPEHVYAGQALSWAFNNLNERRKHQKRQHIDVPFVGDIHCDHISDAFTEVETHEDFRRLMLLLSPTERIDVMRWLMRQGNVVGKGNSRRIGQYSFERARQRFMAAVKRLRKVAK